jgi:hypothetical protein
VLQLLCDRQMYLLTLLFVLSQLKKPTRTTPPSSCQGEGS